MRPLSSCSFQLPWFLLSISTLKYLNKSFCSIFFFICFSIDSFVFIKYYYTFVMSVFIVILFSTLTPTIQICQQLTFVRIVQITLTSEGALQCSLFLFSSSPCIFHNFPFLWRMKNTIQIIVCSCLHACTYKLITGSMRVLFEAALRQAYNMTWKKSVNR